MQHRCNDKLDKGRQIAFGDAQILCRLYQQYLDKNITLSQAEEAWKSLERHYDYLVVGAGLFGAAFAQQMKAAGKSVLVIEKRSHIGGNVYTEEVEGIQVHRYGAHIFHTDSRRAWDYVNSFAEFNRYTNSPIANFHGELYSLPFNMYTFHQMWGVNSPQQAMEIIAAQRSRSGITSPQNLEEQAISLVGTDIYEKLVNGYTQKQWGRPCRELPAFIIRRLPVRYTYDNRESKSGSIQTIWKKRHALTPWRTKWSTPAPSTPISASALGPWPIAPFALRRRCWTLPTSRATPW